MIETGIFKQPVDTSIYLGHTDVKNDSVIDRKHHGGIDKACYAYNSDQYPFWKKKYPEVDMNYGAFGENLTIENLDESLIYIGDQYKVGEAIIEVSQPRQPCYKQGIRFNTQKIVKDFINEPYPGVYFRVIKEGKVNVGDTLEPISSNKEFPSVADVHSLFSNNKSNIALAKTSLFSSLAESYKEDIRRKFKL